MSSPAQHLARMRDAAIAAGRWCAVASLFVVPVNKPATNIALGLSLIFSLLGSDFRRRWVYALKQPIPQGFLVWCAVLVLSAIHTWHDTGTLPLGGTFVWVCLYPLIFATLLDDRHWRRRALAAFAMAMILVLAVSYGMALGVVPQRDLADVQPAMRNTVFKEYTQQGLAMLILGSMAAAWASVRSPRRPRFTLIGVVLLILVDVLFLVESRTTYITLIPILGYWLWRLWLKGRMTPQSAFIATVIGVAAIASVWFIPPVHQRLAASVSHEFDLYEAQHMPTSTGIRLELWRRTLPIIESAPIFGHGLSAWEPLYRASIEGTPHFEGFLMGHPHQEMLLIVAEQGLVGLAIYLSLLAALARYIGHIDGPERDIYACILLIYLTAGLANCLWADFSHRHMFVLLLACIPLASKSTSPMATPPGIA